LDSVSLSALDITTTVIPVIIHTDTITMGRDITPGLWSTWALGIIGTTAGAFIIRAVIIATTAKPRSDF
jgi:hypothetical protein